LPEYKGIGTLSETGSVICLSFSHERLLLQKHYTIGHAPFRQTILCGIGRNPIVVDASLFVVMQK
jgi:hypothetical protein